jgi:chromate reductase, NAD(P)H dehydrogenase (quinone)
MPSPDPALRTVLAIAGSLRRESFNRRTLLAASALAPSTLKIDVFDDLAAVPLFNEDLEAHHASPGVEQLRSAIADADGLLIATPEYNQSLPGVVKNMVDWLSRGEPVVLEGKAVGILGATPGNWGTRLAQSMLRHTLTACGALVMPTPQLYLRSAAELFDAQGRLIDSGTQDSLAVFLAAFDEWMRRQQWPRDEGRKT